MNNAILTVNINREKEAYFKVELENIAPNDIFENGLFDAWCIDIEK